VATLQITLSGNQYPVEVIVADLMAKAILGIDFLEANHCTNDFPQRSLFLKGNDEHISLSINNPEWTQCCIVLVEWLMLETNSYNITCRYTK